MNLAASLLGYRRFLNETEILHKVRTLDSGSPEAPKKQVRSLLIFTTSRQHTWLVSTGERLYFILDDVRRPEPIVMRSVPRDDLQTRSNGAIAVSTRTKSASTGLVDVGLGRRWLYSKKLFADRSIEQAVNERLFNEPDAPQSDAGPTHDVAH